MVFFFEEEIRLVSGGPPFTRIVPHRLVHRAQSLDAPFYQLCSPRSFHFATIVSSRIETLGDAEG